MQVDFVKISGGCLGETIDTNATWVCPRAGEIVLLQNHWWTVESLWHEIEEQRLTIYVEGRG